MEWLLSSTRRRWFQSTKLGFFMMVFWLTYHRFASCRRRVRAPWSSWGPTWGGARSPRSASRSSARPAWGRQVKAFFLGESTTCDIWLCTFPQCHPGIKVAISYFLTFRMFYAMRFPDTLCYMLHQLEVSGFLFIQNSTYGVLKLTMVSRYWYIFRVAACIVKSSIHCNCG